MKHNPRKPGHCHVSGWSKASLCSGMVGLLVAAAAGAQMHKVEAPQKVTRAVGVYEWTGDLNKPTAARLVPVTVFINGRLEDAGVYMARPEPFALQAGIAYEVDQAGKPLGTLNLDSAKDIVTRHSATDDNPVSAWYGYGTFVLPSAAQPSHLKVSTSPSVIVSSGHDTANGVDDEPHLARRAGSESGTGTPGTATTPSSTPATTNPAPAADSDRPTLSRRADTTPPTSNAPASPTPTVGADDNDRPTLRHRDPGTNAKPKKQEDGGAVIPLNTSLNDDPNRPVMRRGKPLGEVSVAPLTGVPAGLHQTAAVSDAAAPEEHDFTRAWDSPAEHDKVLQSLQTLARPRIESYIATNHLLLTDPALKPPPAASAARSGRARQVKPSSTPSVVPLADEQLKGYELTYGGLPTYVYSAETTLFSGGPVYVTMVAQALPAGNLQVSFASVTDAAHLDRTPWFRFVDAVDPDGSHRASLLFELRAQSSRQFALYRLITANAEQSFVTGIIE